MESALANIGIFLPTADSVFLGVLLSSVVFFVLIELGWSLRKYWAPKSLQIPKQHVDIFWSLIPALVLIFLLKAF